MSLRPTQVRKITVSKETFEAAAYDPYGLWVVRCTSLSDKANQPKQLSGRFTSMNNVMSAVTAYVAEKQKVDVSTLTPSIVNPRGDDA